MWITPCWDVQQRDLLPAFSKSRQRAVSILDNCAEPDAFAEYAAHYAGYDAVSAIYDATRTICAWNDAWNDDAASFRHDSSVESGVAYSINSWVYAAGGYQHVTTIDRTADQRLLEDVRCLWRNGQQQIEKANTQMGWTESSKNGENMVERLANVEAGD